LRFSNACLNLGVDLMPEYIVRAYRIREVTSLSSAGGGNNGFDPLVNVSFLVEDGPDGSDDVTLSTIASQVPKPGDYWVNPFGDGHVVSREVFEKTYFEHRLDH